MTDHDRKFYKVASESDVPEGRVTVVMVENHRVALCKTSEGYFAIDDRCTHDNGPLGEGELVDGEIECPRHGARFDVHTGKAMCLPATGRVPCYAVEVKDGEIYVGLPPL